MNDEMQPAHDGAFDSEGNRFRRRMSDHKIQQLAENVYLRAAANVVGPVALAVLTFVGKGALDKLDRVEQAMQEQAMNKATTELRVVALERSNADTAAAIKLLTEQSLKHSYDIDRLKSAK